MSEMERLRRKAAQFKEMYPVGSRVRLDHMSESDPDPIPSGTLGTVLFVDDIGTVHCKFDNGRQLGLCSEVDSFCKVVE